MQALYLIRQKLSQLFRNRKNHVMFLILFIVIINSASFGSIQLHTAGKDKQRTHQMMENFDSPSFEAETSGKENIGNKTPEIEKLSLLKAASIKSIQAYTPFPTEISISGNSDFVTKASTNNWDDGGSLTGSKDYPFTINNLDVTPVSSSNPAIRIEDTDLYFNITNCRLRDGRHGIEFVNVTHGLVYNNIIRNNTDEGVKLSENSTDNKLIHNTIYNNTRDGIYVWNSGNNTIVNNIAYKNGYDGISIRNSHNCTVNNNICYENSLNSWSTGIRFYNCSFSTMKNNTVFDQFNSGEGVTIEDSPNCTFYNITVSNNSYRGFSANNCNSSTFDEIKSYYNDDEGIEISYSENSSFTNFKCVNNSQNGIEIYSSGNSTFSNLVCNNNSYVGIRIEFSGNSEIKDILCENQGGSGLQIRYSNYSTLTNIAVSNNNYGLDMEQTHYCTLYNISSSFNRNHGIYFQDCSNSVLSNSKSYNNSNKGIELSGYSGSSFIKINNNHFYNNNDGVYISQSDNVIFSGNRVYKNMGVGISLSDSDNSQVVSNVIYDNNGNGISLYNTFNGNISFNTIYRNMYKGIQCSFYSDNGGGPSTIITKNDLIYNDWYEIEIFRQIRLEGDSNILDDLNVNHNFYDTYRTPDDSNDGIVDYPYVIGDYWVEEEMRNNYYYDDFPETEPINPAVIHYLSTPLILSPTQWDPATEWMPEPEFGHEYEDKEYYHYNGTVTIELLAPIDSEGHSITYSLYYTREWTFAPWYETGLQDWTLLASGITTTTYDWDTTTVTDDDYNLAVVATCSEGLNSTFIDTERIQINNSPPELTNLTSFPTVSLILSAFVVITVIQRKKKRV